MQKGVVVSSSRDIPILLFLWKWRVSTTAALIKKFFPNCAARTAYNRVLRLREGGLIKARADGVGQDFVCTLDMKGFRTIRRYLPHLREEGFKSDDHGHDLLVSAFHLGEWLCEKPQNATLLSGQELKRTFPELLPSWVPRSENHRPDGYTRIQVGEKYLTYAIEAELTYKNPPYYENVAAFYESARGIDRILWIVPGESMATNLNSKMKTSSSANTSPHNFAIFKEFKELGWEAKIAVGPDAGKSLSNLYSGNSRETERKLTGSSLVHSLLDVRKSPHTAIAYRGYEVGDFRD